ncbi:swi5-dependent recombination DNA repair protein 1 homolog [Pelobates fuscus]|uniref:swi5-dependent recombination DNA repair protein 1 homolog n=1 Tax=Pelobates fuscus TaxID=191477 RepID=UPI002FE47183
MCNMEAHYTHHASLCTTKQYPGSPDPQNNVVGNQPMSATLRERLRKSRRSFSSACPVVKRLKIDSEDIEGSLTNNSNVCEDSLENVKNTVLSGAVHSNIQTGDVLSPPDRMSLESLPQTTKDRSTGYLEMVEEKRRLLKRVEDKEEFLRRLKMVKLYRAKNNLTELHSLIEKWRTSSQQVLYELQTTLSSENSKISLTQLIENCNLDDKLLQYNRAEEDFENL